MNQADNQADNQGGFTLVELLVWMMVTGIILAGVANLLTASLRIWHTGKVRNEMQQTARIAVDVIVREAQYCKSISVNADGSILTLVNADNQNMIFKINPVTNALGESINGGPLEPFAGDGTDRQEGKIIVTVNADNTPMFLLEGSRTLKITITLKNRMSAISETVRTQVVCMNL
ncbi:MAG TPA: prepilin-type N-terminal cleavage/methylation domain-containing protein [Methylomusa anaerophila]|uniref:PilW family protein n=1 Tax=Methylomusa anaerophila TaxID=1930071 RepID=UPI0022B295BC|nr:prepilin-type N-terminal cleavage/methylation domain-containing protein [Methylomusa anaerophila]HML86851.1 prepilin-type N-terminal cleavage/methylation domain-containing protein [Methylomusa anaerophila]